MAGYQYRCATHGFVEAQFAIGTAPATVECVSCRTPAPRVFSAPALTTRNAPGAKALEMHEKSQSAPGVVVRSANGPAERPRRGAAGAYPRLPRP